MANGERRGWRWGRGKGEEKSGRLVDRKGAWKKNLLEALKVIFHPVPSHVRTRLVPQKPTKTFRGLKRFFPPPCPRHMFEPARSHKSPQNFRGPEKIFSTTLSPSHVRTRLAGAWPHKKPTKLSGPEKFFFNQPGPGGHGPPWCLVHTCTRTPTHALPNPTSRP